ncbi:DNA methyltransferase [Methylobacterium sp. Leaf91]|uniref:DNA methyltransferase n=1 Tax=Methylobacterium sp. Leaf91 TaxID=1736247 RepID=UPI001FCDC9C4|nr:DNA methyltransferase [Methylobacterium sp. Leaf91]
MWSKTNPGQGSLYRSQHELIALYKVGTASHTNNVELGRHGRNRSNVWTYSGANTFKGAGDLALHPTVKPVALVVDAIKDVTRRGAIVLDPFSGSGTTLLAAEKTGTRSMSMSLSGAGRPSRAATPFSTARTRPGTRSDRPVRPLPCSRRLRDG